MTLFKSYKKYNKVNNFIKEIPFRVLGFKRPKWKKVQNFLKKKINKRILLDFSKKKIHYRYWDRIKNFYKNGLQIKSSYQMSLGNSLKVLSLKRDILGKNVFSNKLLLKIIVKPIFRLDIFIWKFNFVSSNYEAKQFIRNGNVFINNKKEFNFNYFLKKGDIISFLIEKFLSKLKTKNSGILKLYKSFTEIDYYTSEIVLIKNFSDLLHLDLSLFLDESFNLRKFVRFFKKI